MTCFKRIADFAECRRDCERSRGARRRKEKDNNPGMKLWWFGDWSGNSDQGIITFGRKRFEGRKLYLDMSNVKRLLDIQVENISSAGQHTCQRSKLEM